MQRVRSLITRFHNDRRGSNSLEQIVIFALGVMVLAGVWWVWKEMPTGGGTGISGFLEKGIDTLTKWVFKG
jgi:hypothetical protein